MNEGFPQHYFPAPRQPKTTMHVIRGSPYTQCPSCGLNRKSLMGRHFFACDNQHTFFACPTCSDTRVSDRRENVLYCGLLHPYHICDVHQRPVKGIPRFYKSGCTCQNLNMPTGTSAPPSNPLFSPTWGTPFS